MKTLTTFVVLATTNQNNNEDYHWPAIVIGAIVVIGILAFTFRKPDKHEEKEKRWELEIEKREEELQDINAKLNGKSFVVIVRTTDKKVCQMESDLIQLLTDGNAEVIRITKNDGDKIMYESLAHDFTCPIITGVVRVDKAEGVWTKYILDLRIWKKGPDGRDKYLATVTLTEEKAEWLVFAFLQHVSSVCKD